MGSPSRCDNLLLAIHGIATAIVAELIQEKKMTKPLVYASQQTVMLLAPTLDLHWRTCAQHIVCTCRSFSPRLPEALITIALLPGLPQWLGPEPGQTSERLTSGCSVVLTLQCFNPQFGGTEAIGLPIRLQRILPKYCTAERPPRRNGHHITLLPLFGDLHRLQSIYFQLMNSPYFADSEERA